jgi:hypothetical protein
MINCVPFSVVDVQHSNPNMAAHERMEKKKKMKMGGDRKLSRGEDVCNSRRSDTTPPKFKLGPLLDFSF